MGEEDSSQDHHFSIYTGQMDYSSIIFEMDRSKTVRRLSTVALVYLIFINIFLVEAQVTFSRDWNAGKRSNNIPDCAIAIKSAAAICQMLLNELRAIATCEMHSLTSQRLNEDVENSQDVFGSQHNG
ncbi:uncharacterized protein [Rhodnius prolixus]|uniref:Adipokinetic hormone/corazonin-related peptide n=1 Tax=Rhodnius prolixus TaxID=13249 RepID=A0A0K0NU63_RHOPR|nr:adipokinetic hormone/corazonin-related peptide [Rhodnius prolixus]